MYPFNLPVLDFAYLSDSTVEAIKSHHNSDEPLNFSGMPECDMDGYIEAWFSSLAAEPLEEFYDDALRSNAFVKDHILETYTDPAAKAETEKTLIRNAFLRPSANPQHPQSWSQKIEECVNEVIEHELVERLA